MTAMTLDEYEDRKRRLATDLVDAKKALGNARANYEQAYGDLQNLYVVWGNQQRAKGKPVATARFVWCPDHGALHKLPLEQQKDDTVWSYGICKAAGQPPKEK